MKSLLSIFCLIGLLTGCSTPPTPTSTPTAAPPTATVVQPTATIDPELNAMVVETSGSNTNVHDPTLIKAGDTYYLFSTGPGISIRCSQDMHVWEICGRVFMTYPSWVLKTIPKVVDLWAPDVVFYKGKYYLYYAASSFGVNQSAIGLATSTTLDRNDPNYKWEDQGVVIASQTGDNFNAIDPNLTFDTSGQPWLVFGSFWSGIKMVKVDPATMKPEAGAQRIDLASRPAPDAIEGAFITHRGDYYYLFASYDFCCRGVKSTYNIRVGRSKDITGPYVDKEGKPMLEDGGTMVFSGSKRWIGPGHNSIYIEDGTYYMVYHAYDAQRGGTPTLHIEALKWDANGWPESPSALLGG